MLNLKDKDVIVLGLGKSGIAACELLVRLGARVIAFDEKNKDELKAVIKKLPKSVIVRCGKITNLPEVSLIVVSPGIPSDISYILKAKESNIPVISEIELAFQMLSGQPIIAITGTNGKTTTTTLCGKILEDAGLNPIVCGNIEIPFTSCISYQFAFKSRTRRQGATTEGLLLVSRKEERRRQRSYTNEGELVSNIKKDNIIILEVSSAQLETIVEFRPNISLFLNFAPDHLDRYPKIEDYMKAKARIFENQTKDDIMVINADDPVVLNLSRRSKAKPYLFSTKQTLQEGLFLRNDWIVARFSGSEERILPLSEIKLIGLHNIENILASILVAILLRVDISSARKTISNFAGLPHRIQEIGVVSGVSFINDSKATNIASVIAALSSFSEPVILLAGGRDKGEDYARLIPIFKEKVKKLILFGESADLIGSMVREVVEIYKVRDLKEAVNLSYALASSDDYVLLSPACSSFDQFSSYKERGEVFTKNVFALKDRLMNYDLRIKI